MKHNASEITYTQKDGWTKVEQHEGPVLGYAPESGCRIIIHDGKAFKSFSGGETPLPYEDWRLPMEQRAADLASRLSIDDIAGLMLYSPQNRLPMINDTYGGKPYDAGSMAAWSLSDGQKKFLAEDNVRHVLVSGVEGPEAAARWNNAVQAFVEGRGFGIPANNSSDPRHSAFFDEQFASGSKGKTSMWSNMLGLAATFSPATVKRFGEIASAEYRALGLATALSPQCDLGTDPRWYRYSSTFGCDPQLVADLTKAYTDGFQTTDHGNGKSGWGRQSVNAMAKHWPGGGMGEGGRDAHYGNGKFAVYPGNCFEAHKIPFTKGAFTLDGGTKQASAIMPYYTIPYNQTGENTGNSFNRAIITDMLRGECGYDGVVCTDWCITHDEIHPGIHSGKPWGVEQETVARRHYIALMAGVDQFGGNQEKQPIIEAYEMGCREHGEEFMRRRMELSATRLLLNIFRPGLFENPYVDVDETTATVGHADFVKEAFSQQLDSVILLKNHNRLLPVKRRLKVWIPTRHIPETLTYWRSLLPARDIEPIDDATLSDFFDRADSPEEADLAIVFIESPKSYMMGYDTDEAKAGGTGYIPISLQYRPYHADDARQPSIAGGDPFEDFTDRSYRGKSCRTINECDLDLVESTRQAMGERPVIAVMMTSNPPVLTEVEPLVDALLMGFDVSPRAYLSIISGMHEPSALLPFELPASMSAVERHCEDRPHDIEPYTDSDGNTYAFGFGLNYDGPVDDDRTRRYVPQKIDKTGI